MTNQLPNLSSHVARRRCRRASAPRAAPIKNARPNKMISMIVGAAPVHSGESSTPTLHIGRDWPGRPPTRRPRFELHGLPRSYTPPRRPLMYACTLHAARGSARPPLRQDFDRGGRNWSKEAMESRGGGAGFYQKCLGPSVVLILRLTRKIRLILLLFTQ